MSLLHSIERKRYPSDENMVPIDRDLLKTYLFFAWIHFETQYLYTNLENICCYLFQMS